MNSHATLPWVQVILVQCIHSGYATQPLVTYLSDQLCCPSIVVLVFMLIFDKCPKHRAVDDNNSDSPKQSHPSLK
jgi:hypothetical protein